jgi:hypothetical protein
MSAANATSWTDFTRANYRRLLLMAKSSYELMPVADFRERARLALWRHDVDASPQGALALASIEQEAGVCATYYFNPKSEFYNLLEPAVSDIARKIAAMGHEVGLHFDAAPADVADSGRLQQALRSERRIFNEVLGIEVRSFSFHNPSPATKPFADATYGGMLNAYGRDLLAATAYCSDSNGYWRFTPLEQFLAGGHPAIYVLTHPEWWQEQPMSPRDRIARCVEGRAAATLNGYDTLLALNNRKNIR